jgi:hypothetical protein
MHLVFFGKSGVTVVDVSYIIVFGKPGVFIESISLIAH